MCEIAVLDPQSTTTRYTFALLERMYEQNNDGVGMVAVDRDRTRLSYASYSAATPTWREVLSFMESHSDAWRMVLHARLATAGETTDLEAHPIPVSCDKCETSMVVHNGIVQSARRSRRKMNDHSFKTAVDSEVIAHKHGDLPDTLDGFTAPRMFGSLNYILFGENRILVRAGYRYDISDDFRMAHDWRKCAPDDGECSRFLLVKPGGTESEPIYECTPQGSSNSSRITRVLASGRSDRRAHVQTSMDSNGKSTSNRSDSTRDETRTSNWHEYGDEDGKSERQRKYERYQSQADAREDAPDDADEAEPDADDGELATQETEMEDYFPGWRNVLNWAKDNGDDPDDDDGDAPGGHVVQL